jgi:hypothetical protein
MLPEMGIPKRWSPGAVPNEGYTLPVPREGVHRRGPRRQYTGWDSQEGSPGEVPSYEPLVVFPKRGSLIGVPQWGFPGGFPSRCSPGWCPHEGVPRRVFPGSVPQVGFPISVYPRKSPLEGVPRTRVPRTGSAGWGPQVCPRKWVP